jgi:uncharacterized protein YbjT (DUF2867 family)
VSPVTAFVAGATGYVGRAVVAALRGHGVPTVAHVRPDSAALPRWQGAFGALGATVDTTPWEPAAMRATLQRVAPTHLFALLGTTRARAARRAAGGMVESYATVDYGLTHLLLEGARTLPAPPRFIYLSAVGVSPGSRNPYLAARARIEGELATSGLPHLIAQPAYITGADREESRPVERTLAALTDVVMGGLDRLGLHAVAGRYRTLDGTTLAAGLVALAVAPGPVRVVVDARALRVAGGPPVTLSTTR